ncbi:hypothetical protein NC651_026121 [Populus alba x Populus x berolinensis]|nr:hypothetical protein NC651_026121 [Populus alba x Populus x berolinensis]
MCVNQMTDWFNCGKCGKKCKYTEICCKGKCVNPMYNKNHCGGCNNKCKKGSACQYGIMAPCVSMHKCMRVHIYSIFMFVA